MAMNVGSFRHLIELQRRTAARDGNGNDVSTWTTFCSLRAAVSDVSGREFYEAAAHQMENTGTFTLRWHDGLTGDMRILFKGAAYEVIQVNHLGYAKRDFMRIKARMIQGEESGYGEL